MRSVSRDVRSNDRDNITKLAKSSFWKSFNILIAEFGKLSPFVISKLFNQYCCNFYGFPLWSISGAAVQTLCVDWRKALRSLWRLNPRTHCDLITALSSQIPLIVSLRKRFAKFINRCLSGHNTTLQFISCVAINIITHSERALFDLNARLEAHGRIHYSPEGRHKGI